MKPYATIGKLSHDDSVGNYLLLFDNIHLTILLQINKFRTVPEFKKPLCALW
jgi:hypothetical protein